MAELSSLVGADGLLTDAADTAPFATDYRRLYSGRALAVALPRSTAEVVEVVRWCARHGVGIVPQGGNTSYCGGATPDDSGRQLVLSLRRMNRIRELDAANFSMTVEAGCVLADIQQAAEAADRHFPLSLGAEGSCQIGGNLATNAGGLNVLRYGMARELVLGVEAVLADGSVFEGLNTLRKNNTGYDLKSLLVGSEGTLGVITAATLKLWPKLRTYATAFVAVRDLEAVVELLERLRAAAGERLNSYELLPRNAIEHCTRLVEGVRAPLPLEQPWYVLCEISSSSSEPLEELLQRALGSAAETGVIVDAAVASNETQRLAFWRLRENIPEAQRRIGPSIKHDISVPVSQLPAFVRRASDWVASQVPEGELISYGHAGDGSLHFNVGPRAGADVAALMAREPVIKRAIHDLVAEFGGSFSAEHGIGRLKVDELARYAPARLAAMRAIKQALDPQGLMNPGKVL